MTAKESRVRGGDRRISRLVIQDRPLECSSSQSIVAGALVESIRSSRIFSYFSLRLTTQLFAVNLFEIASVWVGEFARGKWYYVRASQRRATYFPSGIVVLLDQGDKGTKIGWKKEKER